MDWYLVQGGAAAGRARIVAGRLQFCMHEIEERVERSFQHSICTKVDEDVSVVQRGYDPGDQRFNTDFAKTSPRLGNLLHARDRYVTWPIVRSHNQSADSITMHWHQTHEAENPRVSASSSTRKGVRVLESEPCQCHN